LSEEEFAQGGFLQGINSLPGELTSSPTQLNPPEVGLPCRSYWQKV
jgi:hypothetical protein